MIVAPSQRLAEAVTERYLDACADGGALSGVFSELSLPPAYRAAYGELRLARPLFVDEDEIVRFGDNLAALYELMASLPERCFGGDLAGYCHALGMDDRLSALLRLPRRKRIELYGRADAYHDGVSFRLLEFNVGSELGGIDAAQMSRAFLEVPAFGEFADRHGLAFVDTADVLATSLRRAAAPVAHDGEPVVALIESPGALREHGSQFAAIKEAMSRYGIHLLLGELQELTTRKGKLVLRGRSLDVVLRYFTAGQLLEYESGRRDLETLVRAHEAGTTALFTPLQHGLTESKANLALVHDPEHRARFTPSEIELVDRIVPWTRTVGTGASTAGAERAELIDECRARRAGLILKPGTACGGVGVSLGRDLDDREWTAKLKAVRDQDYVVQEIVSPAPERVPDSRSGELHEWQANWGIFATQAGYAGAFIRALRSDDGAVVCYSNRETRGTCVFSCGRGTR
jgi:hypothetical protein